jgi:hypothetical protein
MRWLYCVWADNAPALAAQPSFMEDQLERVHESPERKNTREDREKQRARSVTAI